MNEQQRHKERRRNQKSRRRKRRQEKLREERRLSAERRINNRIEKAIQERLNVSKTKNSSKMEESRKKEQFSRKRPAEVEEASAVVKRGRVGESIKEIDISHVVRTNQFLGSGTFGSCYLGRYRNLPIVIKELKSRKIGNETKEETEKRLRAELLQEAKTISQLGDHPGLPLLFGISSGILPFRLIMQFHGSKDGSSLTIHKAISSRNISQKKVWEQIIGNVAHALSHVHQVGILHNDLKANNIVLDEISAESYQPVIIDFGKSRPISRPKGPKTMNLAEQEDYRKLYPHIAPEIVRGLKPQSPASDVYSLGFMTKAIYKTFKFGALPQVMTSALRSVSDERPTALKVYEFYFSL